MYSIPKVQHVPKAYLALWAFILATKTKFLSIEKADAPRGFPFYIISAQSKDRVKQKGRGGEKEN